MKSFDPVTPITSLAEKFANYRNDYYSFKGMPKWKKEYYSYIGNVRKVVTLPSTDTLEWKAWVKSLEPDMLVEA